MIINSKDVQISAIVTVVPETIRHYTDDATRLGMPEKQAARIKKTIGLDRRHIAAGPTTALDLGEAAALRMLDGHDIDRAAIDGLIFVTQTPDHFQPSNAAILHGRLGLTTKCAAFDIALGCSGFVYGLSVASSMLNSSDAEHILLICADTLSKCINPGDRSAGLLFGDAGSAILVSKATGSSITFSLNSDGEGSHHIQMPAGAFRMPKSDKTSEAYITDDGNVLTPENLIMDGGEVFNFSLSVEPTAITDMIAHQRLQDSEIDYIFFHQANKYIISNIIRRLKFPAEKAPMDIVEQYGNQSSASIPCAINHTLGGTIDISKNIIVSGFGVGLSWATAHLIFEPNFCPPVHVQSGL